jgi:uncharacterized membrane protein
MPAAAGKPSPLAFTSARRALDAMIALWILHGLVAAVSLRYLPRIMPVHFDAAGIPDAWSSATLGSWFLLWLLSGGFGAAMLLGAFATFRVPPRFFSLPRKDEFLALPPARRERVLATLAFHVLVIGAVVMLTFLGIQLGVILVALEVIARFPVAVVFASFGLVLVETVVMIAALSSGIRRETAAHVRGLPA